MSTRWWRDRARGLSFWAGLLALLGGSALLVIAAATKGLEKANTLGSAFGTGLAIVGALVTLLNWCVKQRSAASQPARSDQVARAAEELHAAVREQRRKEAEAPGAGGSGSDAGAVAIVRPGGDGPRRPHRVYTAAVRRAQRPDPCVD